MKVAIEFGGYNSRRFGKPWGALVKFEGAKLVYDFSFGTWLGDDTGGNVYVECYAGDVIASGQKDTRSGQSRSALYIVGEDGSHKEVDRVAAYEHWEALKAAPKTTLDGVSTEDLLAELERRGIDTRLAGLRLL